jgi:hypothetical protein
VKKLVREHDEIRGYQSLIIEHDERLECRKYCTKIRKAAEDSSDVDLDGGIDGGNDEGSIETRQDSGNNDPEQLSFTEPIPTKIQKTSQNTSINQPRVLKGRCLTIADPSNVSKKHEVPILDNLCSGVLIGTTRSAAAEITAPRVADISSGATSETVKDLKSLIAQEDYEHMAASTLMLLSRGFNHTDRCKTFVGGKLSPSNTTKLVNTGKTNHNKESMVFPMKTNRNATKAQVSSNSDRHHSQTPSAFSVLQEVVAWISPLEFDAIHENGRSDSPQSRFQKEPVPPTAHDTNDVGMPPLTIVDDKNEKQKMESIVSKLASGFSAHLDSYDRGNKPSSIKTTKKHEKQNKNPPKNKNNQKPFQKISGNKVLV